MALGWLKDFVLASSASISKKDMSAFCFVETTDENLLIGQDGSVGTMLRIDGIRQMMGGAEFEELVEKASNNMSTYFSRRGRALQVWFCRDPDLSKPMVKEMMTVPRTVARRQQLDLDSIFDENESHLPKFMVYEAFYMVLWTRLTILSKAELKKSQVEMKKPSMWPQAADAQNIFMASRIIMSNHQAFVTSFVKDLGNLGIRTEVMPGIDALRAMRASIYPDTNGSKWTPRTPDVVPPDPHGGPATKWTRRPEQTEGDVSHLMWPRIATQVFDRDAEVLNSQRVRIGRFNFAAVDMTVGPNQLQTFSYLIDRIMDLGEFPWRVSFLIEGDGLGYFAIRKLMAGIASVTNKYHNRQVRKAILQLEEEKAESNAIVRMRVSFCTWAPAGDAELIEDRSNSLQKAIETWGNCEVAAGAGDPLAGTLSSAVGLDVRSTAPPCAAPIRDVAWLLPWMRDASPFTDGSVLFRTPDGRPWPYQPGSSKQDTFIDIIFAPPGKGKSVFLNTTGLAFALSAKASAASASADPELPRIAIIDIGPSSSGLISLLREALPPERRHEAVYKRLQNTREFAINPFDTQLGCRTPLQLDREFLVNLITVLGTDVGEPGPPLGLSALAGAAVDELYEMFSDRSREGRPRPYTVNVDKEVDVLLKKIGVVPEDDATWWSIVDTLFEMGYRKEASLAQRYAMPRVEDIRTVVRTQEIQDVFGSAKVANQELLVSVFERVISTIVRDYKILSVPTRFDLGNAKVVALDLDEIAPGSGGRSDKQTAVAYMLARFAVARDFYLNPEAMMNALPRNDHGELDQGYLKYHMSRIRKLKETPKKLVFDEFHRTKATKIVRDQVKVDMREGRKWGVQISLASQLLDDFDEDMIALATGYWIMGVNDAVSAEKAVSIFGLSQSARNVIRNDLNGPTAAGAPFLSVLNLKDGRHEHLLYNTLGPQQMWAFSTTAEDVQIRNRLYDLLDPTDARRRLAARYSGGSAKKDIERRLVLRMERGENDRDAATEGIVDEIVSEILKR